MEQNAPSHVQNALSPMQWESTVILTRHELNFQTKKSVLHFASKSERGRGAAVSITVTSCGISGQKLPVFFARDIDRENKHEMECSAF